MKNEQQSFSFPQDRIDQKNLENASSSFDESLILKRLSKMPRKKIVRKAKMNKNIFKRLQIVSNKELEINKIKYFKYPFSPKIVNDGSKLFDLLYDEWITAFIDLFELYRERNQYFYVLSSDMIFIFKEKVFCSVQFKEILLKKKIKFEKIENLLEIDYVNSVFIFDHILNLDLSISKSLPFLLSRSEFTNSMFYEAKIVDKKQIQDKNVIKWYHTVEGYLYGPDYEQYAEYDIIYEF